MRAFPIAMLALTLLGGRPARAGDVADQPDAAMMRPVIRVADFIKTGRFDLLDRTFADRGVSIIENFAPFVFTGNRTVERWATTMQRSHLNGTHDLTYGFGRAVDFSRSGETAYFSLPTRWTGIQDGRAFIERGGWAYVLVDCKGRWRIRSYGWAVVAQQTGG